jgi:uncharacterized repeat protein (TIGR03803 family)
MRTNSTSSSDLFRPRGGGSNRPETRHARLTVKRETAMQLRWLLRTAATAAMLTVLLLTTFQKAQAQTEAVLYNFCSVGGCLDGELPNGTLTPDGYGGFYGTTEFGGTSGDGPNCYFDEFGCGTVFQLVPEPAGGCPSGSTAGNGWCEYIVYNFCQVSTGASPCADGSTPSSLIVTRTGSRENPITTLYGTTSAGGATCVAPDMGSACGTVFQISPETPPLGCPSGTNRGNNGWCEQVIYNFCGCGDGGFPTGSLIRDSAGNLYGPAYNGVFEVSPINGGWTEDLIYDDPNYVVGGLAMGASGSLYGVDQNQNQATPGWGTVFELLFLDGEWTSGILHTFDNSLVGAIPDGLFPYGPPTLDSAGNLYGTTAAGGSSNLGTVWKLTPVTTGSEAGTYKEKILHSFTSVATGDGPIAGVTLDASGNIYGTTASGGKYLTQCKSPSGTPIGCGTVFELPVDQTATSETYKYKLLWSFNNTDGEVPSNLVLDNSGHLYGAVEGGGATIQGAVFEVNPSGAATTTSLTSSLNPSISGAAVTFTATVSSSAGAPPDGETVNFMKGTTVLGTGTLSAGSASFTTSSLPVGTSVVDAVYSGDLNFEPGTSNKVKEVVKK